ncbi:MAG: PAS domain-containing protein [Proteobacteria bacterium]|nr:PAS domain-containing protein [Pseudomonadota bacterium]
MRVLVDRVPSMLAYWDRDLLCRYANRAYEYWFGVNPEALVGTSIRDLLGPDLFAMNEPYIRGALGGEQQVFERIVPGPDGVRRHSLATYIPEVVDGEVLGFFVQVTEVTQLREVESALARERALRAQVEADAVKLGELLGERSEMLHVLAHEVRQPLNNAMAALQGAASALAATDALAAEPLASAELVLGQVASRLDNTLAVASLLARADPIERQDVDVNLLIALVVADLPVGDRSRIVTDQRSAVRTASMDLGLMRLALRNVLSNALRHGPKGTSVTIRLADSDDPLALLIDVVDQGQGVEADFVPRLFERGAHGRGADRLSRQGLGLYIVRRVMELHGGLAMVASNSPGEFTVRLVLDQT